jgi:imidazolonepropionase-like amidohydrolase
MSGHLVIRGATLHTADLQRPVIERGTVVVRDGRIVSVGPDCPITGDAVVIEAAGLHLCPGFVDAHTHVGNWFEGLGTESRDINEMTRPITPELRAIDGVWPGDVAFAKARAAGVTTVCTLPGSANVVGGTVCVLKTLGHNVDDMALEPDAALKVAFGYNVKHSHGIKKGRAPLTRMAIASMFRETFDAALAYEQRQLLEDNVPRHRGNEVLLRALRREIPVRAHAYRSDDLQQALRLAKAYGLDLVLEHAYEADLCIDQLVAQGAKVIHGPVMRLATNSEKIHMRAETVVALHAAGVPVAISTDYPDVPIQYLTVEAGLCVRAGLSPEAALRAITAVPAGILGVADRVGSLTPGLHADLVLLDGPPLEIASVVQSVFIEGEQVFRVGDPMPVPGQRQVPRAHD